MGWIAERFSDSDYQDTAQAADRFVRSLPLLAEATEGITETVKKRLGVANGSIKYKRRCGLTIPTSEFIGWSNELGICVGQDQELDPTANLEISYCNRFKLGFIVRPSKTVICAYLSDLGNIHPIITCKIALYDTFSKIVFSEGVFRIASDHLLSAKNLLQLEAIINKATPI